MFRIRLTLIQRNHSEVLVYDDEGNHLRDLDFAGHTIAAYVYISGLIHLLKDNAGVERASANAYYAAKQLFIAEYGA